VAVPHCLSDVAEAVLNAAKSDKGAGLPPLFLCHKRPENKDSIGIDKQKDDDIMLIEINLSLKRFATNSLFSLEIIREI